MKARLYGIPNCDKVRAARAWLAAHGQPVVFVDFKRTPPTQALLERWLSRIEAADLINRSGTTWRRLGESARSAAATCAGAAALMLGQPSVIRRPVLERGACLFVGFDAGRYAEIFHE